MIRIRIALLSEFCHAICVHRFYQVIGLVLEVVLVMHGGRLGHVSSTGHGLGLLSSAAAVVFGCLKVDCLRRELRT